MLLFFSYWNKFESVFKLHLWMIKEDSILMIYQGEHSVSPYFGFSLEFLGKS